MKKYMVACDIGVGCCYLGVYHIEMPDDYIPDKDGLCEMKEKIISKYRPKVYCMRTEDFMFNNSARVRLCETPEYLSYRELRIVAISRTDL